MINFFNLHHGKFAMNTFENVLGKEIYHGIHWTSSNGPAFEKTFPGKLPISTI